MINAAINIRRKIIPSVNAHVILTLGRYIVAIKNPKILTIKKDVDNGAYLNLLVPCTSGINSGYKRGYLSIFISSFLEFVACGLLTREMKNKKRKESIFIDEFGRFSRMKHALPVTFWLVGLFCVAQLIGLGVLQQYTVVGQEEEVLFREIPSFFGLGFERPVLSPSATGIALFLGILLGTALALFLLRSGLINIWKVWYALAVIICLHVVFASILKKEIAELFALGAGLWKVLRPNVLIHNLTEVLMYGGLAAFVVPLLSFPAVLILFVLVGLYDAYAVWKSQHMIALAQFQMKSGVFGGLALPYHVPHKPIKKKIQGKPVAMHAFRTAILGGGDIAFPLLFFGVVQREFGFGSALFSVGGAALALFLLLVKGDKNAFYPAIPFLLAGSLLGFGMSFLF